MGVSAAEGRKGGKDPVMDTVTLRFGDAELEGCFRSSWRSATRSLGFWWRAGSTAYYIIFSVLLAVYDHDFSPLLNGIHLFVCLPIAFATIFAPFVWPRLERYCNPAFLGLLILVLLVECLQLRAADTPVAYLYLLNASVIMIFTQQFPSNRLTGTILLSLLFGLIAALAIYTFGGSPFGREIPMLPFCGILIAFTIIGMFSAYNKELFVRRNYHAIQSLKLENARSEKLANDAVAALEAKSRFLAIVGHEFRTPLNAILGFSELMLSGVIGQVRPARAGGYVEGIFQSGTHLMQLVESVIDYTRSGSGMIRITEEEVPPEKLINDVHAGIESTLSTRHQTLNKIVADDVPVLRIDANQIRQCLANLISNASKFSPVGSEITCKALKTDDGSVQIVVIDRGCGFDDRKAELLFDPFAQAEDDLNRRTDGLGIGLPLTRALMQAHDGEVRLSSRPGVGTEAALVFPAARCRPTTSDDVTEVA
ncbi:HAMP domain-containing sensor histidine kinase [Minwuia sp. IMCC3077]|uniref:sensor histidine kinase n=1 Tax=Minwuia sp. IMCC3077 TaxID=3040676 RepID=UPI00247A664D|nr:HAMP domain-containing sensor histidine kinase [Minwuia sp. IMCC3077]